jgi:hypothetical protein
MNVQSTKIELAKLILGLENPVIIQNIADFLKMEIKDFWNELSEAEKEEIKFGIKQLDKGERTSLDDYLKRVS